ncbi:hypothetical protein LTR97_001846 [Elasticomyces elasticus]|uniref:DUF2423 domain-containing protein n=1 Tax=Elasticomyces elasticus TaxID=574655 RepID=A0AAN8A684_9PEZI|nr:hypothetical protein LTR97_001846 [Elasticomyces elasticus]
MARSARSSSIKKNKSGLKKRVFGPVESGRNARLSAKLLELAQQAKAPRTDMEVVEESASKDAEPETKEEQTMDVDKAPARKLRRGEKEEKPRMNRVTKSKRRARNEISFAPTGRAKSKKGSKR